MPETTRARCARSRLSSGLRSCKPCLHIGSMDTTDCLVLVSFMYARGTRLSGYAKAAYDGRAASARAQRAEARSATALARPRRHAVERETSMYIYTTGAVRSNIRNFFHRQRIRMNGNVSVRRPAPPTYSHCRRHRLAVRLLLPQAGRRGEERRNPPASAKAVASRGGEAQKGKEGG